MAISFVVPTIAFPNRQNQSMNRQKTPHLNAKERQLRNVIQAASGAKFNARTRHLRLAQVQVSRKEKKI